MPNYCNIQLGGHLGRDPELRQLASGKSVCNFNVAVSYGKKDARRTTWFRCQAWDETAEQISQEMQKGDGIEITKAYIECRPWEDRDGNKRESWDVTVQEYKKYVPEKEPYSDAPPPPVDDDIPF